jgi:hypothetical protein
MKKQIIIRVFLSMALVTALGALKGFAAEVSVLSRAQWLNKIGDSVQSKNELSATLMRLSPADKKEFLQRALKAVTRMPVTPEEKAAAFVRTAAVMIASEADGAKYELIAEAFACVPVEYLPVLIEQLRKGFEPQLVQLGGAQRQAVIGDIVKTAVARNTKTDDPAVRNTFALLAFMSSGESSESLNKLLELLPDDRTRGLAASWVQPARNDGNYEAMLAAAAVEPLALTTEEVVALVGDSAKGVGAGIAGRAPATGLSREQGLGKSGDSVRRANVVGKVLKQAPATDRLLKDPRHEVLLAQAEPPPPATPKIKVNGIEVASVDVLKSATELTEVLNTLSPEEKIEFFKAAAEAIAAMSGTPEEKAAVYGRTAVACIASVTGAAQHTMIATVFAVVPMEHLPSLLAHVGGPIQRMIQALPEQQRNETRDAIIDKAVVATAGDSSSAERMDFVMMAVMGTEGLTLIMQEFSPPLPVFPEFPSAVGYQEQTTSIVPKRK